MWSSSSYTKSLSCLAPARPLSNGGGGDSGRLGTLVIVTVLVHRRVASRTSVMQQQIETGSLRTEYHDTWMWSRRISHLNPPNLRTVIDRLSSSTKAYYLCHQQCKERRSRGAGDASNSSYLLTSTLVQGGLSGRWDWSLVLDEVTRVRCYWWCRGALCHCVWRLEAVRDLHRRWIKGLFLSVKVPVK